jgi:hypothetical protein
VHVDPNILALYLAEHALLQATGQTWETATGSLPALLKRTISETVGAGAAWTTLVTRLQAAPAMLYAALSLLDGDASVGAAAGILSEAIDVAVPADAQAALRDTLRAHISTLALVLHALETGDYLIAGK